MKNARRDEALPPPGTVPSSRSPERGRAFVVTLAACSGLTILVACALAWRAIGLSEGAWILGGVISLAMLVFERHGFVFYWRELGTKISLDEVALFVGFAYLSPPLVVLAAGAASGANQLLSGRSRLKSLFNVAQHTLAAALAALLVTALAALGAGPLAQAAAGTLTYAFATPAILSLLFSRLENASAWSVFTERFGGSTLASSLLGVALGSTAVSLWDRSPFAILALLPVLYFLRRFGHLSAWADEELRAAKRLASVSTSVAGRGDLDGVADRILAACGDLFACGEAHLSLDSEPGARRSWTRSFDEGAAGTGGVTVPVLGADEAEIGGLAIFPRRSGHAYGARERYLLSTVAASCAAAASNARALALVESKNAELGRSERRYRDLFETANALVHVLDEDGRIVDSNAAGAAALGIAPRDLRGRRLEEFVLPSEREAVRRGLEAVHEGGEMKGIETRLAGAGGREVAVLLDARALVEPDGVQRIVASSRDVTALKGLEADLRRSMEAQGETIRRLENANRELEDFTLWTTHDMREPLRSVGTLAKALADEIGKMPEDEARDLAERIHVSSERLKDRVKGLHAFSRIVQHDVPFEDVDLHAVVESTLASMEARVRERGATIVLPRERFPVVRAQPHRIDQVVSNLVENALKYAGESARVEIGCDESEKGLRFFVRDDGVGIPREYHERIFQLFQRGPATAGETGSGAGLAIVKRIVEQHGGRAWVDSEPGEGATFSFTLPQALSHRVHVPDRRLAPHARAAPERRP